MNQVVLEPLTAVNPTWSSIWNASQMAGGAESARPYKNQFTGHFDPNFLHNLDLGTKMTLDNFLKLDF